MIDPQARIDPSAEVADDVEIGPWTWIGPDVSIGPGCKIASHVVVRGPTTIGKNNRIFQFSTIGEDTPDLKYKGEATRLEIGDDNIIREGVTIHRGTVQDRGATTVGSRNLLMAYVHIAHDCVVGDDIILVNNASLAGHVTVDNWAIVSGYALIHQFCSIGAHAYVGMASHVTKDVPTYMLAYGQPAEVRTYNQEGLRRRDFTPESMLAIKRAFKLLYRQGLKLDEALLELRSMAASEPVLEELLQFIENTRRGIIR